MKNSSRGGKCEKRNSCVSVAFVISIHSVIMSDFFIVEVSTLTLFSFLSKTHVAYYLFLDLLYNILHNNWGFIVASFIVPYKQTLPDISISVTSFKWCSGIVVSSIVQLRFLMPYLICTQPLQWLDG